MKKIYIYIYFIYFCVFIYIYMAHCQYLPSIACQLFYLISPLPIWPAFTFASVSWGLVSQFVSLSDIWSSGHMSCPSPFLLQYYFYDVLNYFFDVLSMLIFFCLSGLFTALTSPLLSVHFLTYSSLIYLLSTFHFCCS